MRLLSASKIKEKKASELEKARQVQVVLVQAIDSKTKELESIRTTTQQEASKLAQELAVYQAEVDIRKKVLAGEIGALETRRDEAMKPLHTLKEMLKQKGAELEAKDAQIKREWVEMNKNKSFLMTWSETLRDKDARLNERHNQLGLEESLLETRRFELSKAEELFNEKLIKANAKHDVLCAQVAGREEVVSKQRLINDATEIALKQLQIELSTKEKRLTAKEARLQRTYKSLKDKGLVK